MAASTKKLKKSIRAAHAPKGNVVPSRPTDKSRVTRMTDKKGRVGLGGRFANRAVIVEALSETELVVRLARVIPESEAWLYENGEALAAVRAGLAQARAGNVTRGPDLRLRAQSLITLRTDRGI